MLRKKTKLKELRFQVCVSGVMSFKYVKNLKQSTLVRKEPPPPPQRFSKNNLQKFVVQHVEAKLEKEEVSWLYNIVESWMETACNKNES